MQSFIHVLIPIAIGATALMVALGLYGLFTGGEFNRNWSNRLMRMRVLLQFVAVILLMSAIFLGGNRPDWFS